MTLGALAATAHWARFRPDAAGLVPFAGCHGATALGSAGATMQATEGTIRLLPVDSSPRRHDSVTFQAVPGVSPCHDEIVTTLPEIFSFGCEQPEETENEKSLV